MASTFEVDREIRCMDCFKLLLVLPRTLSQASSAAYDLGRKHGMVLHTHTCPPTSEENECE